MPKPGQTIEEAVCEELEVEGLSETEFYNPKLLTAMDYNYEGMMMLGRKPHRPDEKENVIANFITGHPEEHWCYGPHVLCFRKGGMPVAIPNRLKTHVLKLVMDLSDTYNGTMLKKKDEEAKLRNVEFQLELEKLRSEQYKTECEKWMHLADLGSDYIFRIKGATEKEEGEWTEATIKTVKDLVEEYITKREELKNE